jgi:hypothetical protein
MENKTPEELISMVFALESPTTLEVALVAKLEELLQRVEELEDEKSILLGRPGII